MKIKALIGIGILAVGSLLARADLIHEWTLNNTTNDAVVGSPNYCLLKIGSTASTAIFTNDSPFGTNYASVDLDQTLQPGCNLSVYRSDDGSGSTEPPQKTYAVWVKANNGWFTNSSAVFNKGASNGSRVNRTSGTATNSILTFLGLGGKGQVPDSKNINIADGHWHHVAFTWDGTNVVFYIDGGQVGSKSTNTTSGFLYLNSFTNLLYIGSVANNSGYFNGRFYDFRIYNTALAAWQIASLTNTPATVLFSDNFNAAVSTNLFDATGRATGTLASNTVYYAWTDTNNVAVNGTLTWAADTNANPVTSLNELTTANGAQNLRFGSAADSGYFDWYPYVNNQVWDVDFDELTANSNPLGFGVTSTPQTGNWASWDVPTYDFGFGNYGSAGRWDIFNQAGANSNNIAGIFGSRPTVYHVRIQFNELLHQVTMFVNGTQVAQTNNMVFAANHRYLSWGEPNRFGGYLDNVQVSVEPSIPVAPFAAIPAPTSLIPNGNFSQVANAVLGSGSVANNYNLNGSHGDYSAFWGSTADVAGWSPYFSDPNGLTTNCIPFTDGGSSYVLNGTFYLDTIIDTSVNAITLNSADDYLNGLLQTNILNGATIQSGAQYQFVVSAGATATTEQYYANFMAGLTVGSGVSATNPATAVPNSLFSLWAHYITTSGTTNMITTVSGADLLAAQGSGPVNVIVNQMSTNGIVGYPTLPNPTDIGQVSQVKVYGVSLTVLVPANDLNHDGVVNQADVNLAQAYLSGSIDGGTSATNRENTLINTYGFTPAQALTYLNLTAFDINGNGYFDAADVAALQALVGLSSPPKLNYSVAAPGQLQLSWNGAFKLQWLTNTLSVGLQTNVSNSWVDYPVTNNPVTVTNDLTIPCAFFRLSQ